MKETDMSVPTDEFAPWQLLHKRDEGVAHYNVMRLKAPATDGMAALRLMFPDAKADEMNAVLFSTSGVHGTYSTIEDAERTLVDEVGLHPGVTFLIIHPRMVTMRYGNAHPQNADDVDFLKRLRASSWAALGKVGAASP